MIYFDVTKTHRQKHLSGLTRVSGRLQAELGAAVQPVVWPDWRREALRPEDWFFMAELCSEAERPGWGEFLQRKQCRVAAIFHDAIPLQFPHLTWPQSVARHPEYMKRLAGCDRVWAVSRGSREDLLGYWRWLGMAAAPPVAVLALGADCNGQPRRTAGPLPPSDASGPPALLCLGILEPRKNQSFLLDVCAGLWREGLAFELHVVGRVNPHFGGEIMQKIGRLRREFRGLRHHGAASDATVAELYGAARATVFPTIAEGCGLPLLESLWMGVPCVHSDLPVLRENAGGGCVPLAPNDAAAWSAALRRVLTDAAWVERLRGEAVARPLPTWADAARTIRAGLAA